MAAQALECGFSMAGSLAGAMLGFLQLSKGICFKTPHIKQFDRAVLVRKGLLDTDLINCKAFHSFTSHTSIEPSEVFDFLEWTLR